MFELFLKVRQKHLEQKLSRDIVWSLSSFFVLAISGIVINVTVAGFRDAASLGIFNLVYAVYIVISQFAVWGIHYSVLRHAALLKELAEERGGMLLTACMLSLLFGFLSAGLTFFGAPFAGDFFKSKDTGEAIQYAAFGLLLFPFNKVLLNYLNGLREMKAFAILQGGRYLLLMLFVSGVALTELPIEMASLGFFFAEAVTSLGALLFLFSGQYHRYLCFSPDWVKTHFAFGSKALAGGMFAEVNSRIDVLLIGYFLSDRETGIYSFAAMLVDGLFQVLAVIRINFNPILVAAVRDNDWGKVSNLRRKSSYLLLPVIVSLSIILVIAYYVLSEWIVPGKGLLEGLPSLIILLVGLNLICVLVPFDNLMVVAGHPGFQAMQQVAIVAANALVAIMLLPVFGIEGAALGTVASYFVGTTMLILFTSHLLGWRLVSNKPSRSF